MLNSRFFVLTGAAFVSIMMLALGTIYALNEANILPLGQQQQVQIVAPAEDPHAATPVATEQRPAPAQIPSTESPIPEAVN